MGVVFRDLRRRVIITQLSTKTVWSPFVICDYACPQQPPRTARRPRVVDGTCRFTDGRDGTRINKRKIPPGIRSNVYRVKKKSPKKRCRLINGILTPGGKEKKKIIIILTSGRNNNINTVQYTHLYTYSTAVRVVYNNNITLL